VSFALLAAKKVVPTSSGRSRPRRMTEIEEKERKQKKTKIMEKVKALLVIRLIWAIQFCFAESMLLTKNWQNNHLLKSVVLFNFNNYILTVFH